MKRMKQLVQWGKSSPLPVLVVIVLTSPAAAQTTAVTQSDIQRLQDNVYLAERDVTQLGNRDTTRANQLRSELDDLRDEVIYLKVKLRKESSLSRTEYADVRDRIEGVRTRAREDATRAAAPAPPALAPAAPVAPAPSTPGRAAAPPASSAPGQGRTAGTSEVPVGTEIDVRLQNALNSGTAMVEDRFEATTLADVNINGRVAIPAGSVMRGVVTDVKPAGRLNRTGSLTVSFDQVTVSGRDYPMRGTVTQTIESEGIKGDVGRGAAGAGVGAIIGGILGGGKGAILGAVLGGGGTIAATEGQQVQLPQGTTLRVRIDSPLQVGSAR
jgi:hypothetical protein